MWILYGFAPVKNAAEAQEADASSRIEHLRSTSMDPFVVDLVDLLLLFRVTGTPVLEAIVETHLG